MADARLTAPTWPEPWGRSYSGAQVRIVLEEFVAAGVIAAPDTALGFSLAGPTIAQHGTDEQKQRLLVPMLRGEDLWCQLFSEPGAGSDLASLSTRAIKDGDHWIINGQKVWNSSANMAQRGVLLARTDFDVPKHAGISYFCIDMDQPGVDARPLTTMSGDAPFCEVFLTDAVVDNVDLLEGPGDGWKVALSTLAFERVNTAGRAPKGMITLKAGAAYGNLERLTGDVVGGTRDAEPRFSGNAIPARKLVALAKERGVNDDALVRQHLAEYYSLTEINRFTQQRIRATAAAGKPVGATASISKLAVANICQYSRELGFEILGADGMLYGESSPYEGQVQRTGLSAFGARIGGGTDEIQRNLLGERALGLPREPQVDRDVAFRDLKTGTQKGSR
jgi:alkylation response protein AidB-like acyl-CoA dehydrogenase